MNSIYDDFNSYISKIETLNPTFLERFSRHPYIGHAHFNSIYDAGSTVTSFQKVETEKAFKESKYFDEKFGRYGWENMGRTLLVENPRKEAKWSFLLISEFYLHIVNGFFQQGYSISIESIKNLTYKKKFNTYVVSFNCEIDFTTYENQIPIGNHDFTMEIGKKLFTDLLTYIEAFKLLAQGIHSKDVIQFSVHSNAFVKEHEGELITGNFQSMNHMINIKYYVDRVSGRVLLGRPSGGMMLYPNHFGDISRKFIMDLSKFDETFQENPEPLVAVDEENMEKLLTNKAFNLISIVIYFEGTRDQEMTILKGPEFITLSNE